MLPTTRLRLRKKVWSKSCVELGVSGTRDLLAYEQPSPQPAESWEGEWRRASADSLDSGYATLSLSNCDPEPVLALASSPAHPILRGNSRPGPSSGSSSSRRKRKSHRRSSCKTLSLRSRAQDRRHSYMPSTRHSLGRTFSLGNGCSSPHRRDTVVHWKAKVHSLVTCHNTAFQEVYVLEIRVLSVFA